MEASILRRARLSLALGAALLGAGCAGGQMPDPVVGAAQIVEAAGSNPAVRQHAPVELDRAQEALARARNAVREGDDRSDVAHLAYLAEQRGQIALERAEARAAGSEVERLGEQRRLLLLQAERQKVSVAQQRAERAQRAVAREQLENRQLQEQLSELETKQTERGLVVTLDDILFDHDRASLKPGARIQIARLADALQTSPQRKVVIEGHTDSTGSTQYNRALSQKRADAVGQALLAEGVDRSRVETRGRGEEFPVATNETAAGRQQNRRVEVIIESPRSGSR